MHQDFVAFFKSKGYTTKKSNTYETIEAFHKTKISKNLFDFLQIHPSFRVLFRAIIKTGEQAVDPDLIYSKMIDQFGKLDTSIIYSVGCNTCKKDIYSLNVAEKNFRISVNDTLHCASCRRTIYNKSIQFHPVYEISKSDLIRYLNAISEKSGLFLSNIALSCIHCENTFNSIEDISNVDLKCPTCGNTRYVIPIYFLEDEINKLIVNKHGYWFEWYIWRKLEKFNPEHSLLLAKGKSKFDVDVCLLRENRIIAIECKDTSQIDDIFKNVRCINETIDKYILIATENVNQDKLDNLEKQLTCDFTYIEPKKIENVENEII
ncbi:MAG TPA: hypothetical protein PKZ65_06035 [Methanoregulaceae archaeon]|nr:hypothetical protein [Methanoregulaceae archaeon]